MLKKDTAEGNKQWKNIPCSYTGRKKCYENGYTTKIKVQSHCIAFQIFHGIFYMFR